MKIIKTITLILAFGLLSANLNAQKQSAELIIQTGHTLGINSIAISQNGKFVASASTDRSIKIWSVESGLELLTLVGHTSEVYSVAFSPDGEKIVSGGGDGVKLWDVKTGKIAENLSGFPTFTVSFSPNGKRIAAGDDETAKVWNLTDLKKTIVLSHCVGQGQLIESQTNAIHSVIFDGDSNRLFTQGKCIGDETDSVYWDISGNSLAENSQCHLYPPRQFENGFFVEIFRNCLEERLKILSKGKTWADIHEKIRSKYQKIIPNFAISSDGKTVVTANDSNLKFWDARTGENLHDKNQFANSVTAVSLSPDNRFLAVKGNGDSIKLYDLSKGDEPKNLGGHSEAIKSIAFDYESKILVSRGKTEYKLWDVFTGNSIVPPTDKKLLPFEIEPTSAISSDGKLYAKTDGGIEIIDILSRNSLPTYPYVMSREVYAVAFSKPNGNNYQLAIIAYGGGDEGTTINQYLVTTLDGSGHAYLASTEGESVGDFRQRINLGRLKKHLTEFPDLLAKWKHYLNEPETTDGKFKLKITGSGKITIFDARTDAELCSLMTFGANDWAVVTPDGLFDGTSQAWKQMRWRLDDNISNLVTIEAFFNEFYYPGLLQEILQGKTPTPSTKDLSEIDIRPPAVRVTEIDNQPTNSVNALSANFRTVKLKIEVEDNREKGRKNGFPPSSGANDLRLFRSGSLVKSWKQNVFTLGKADGCTQVAATKDRPRKAVCETDVSIAAGDNDFTAYAFNHDNVKSNDATAKVEGKFQKKDGTLYVIAVGVNKYANPRFDLKYAVPDADSFAQTFQQQQQKLGNYKNIVVVPLLDGDATKTNILLALNQLSDTAKPQLSANVPPQLAKLKRSEPEDAVIFYFAGHGLADQPRFYLVPHDLGYAGERTKQALTNGLPQMFASSVSDLELEAGFRGVDAGRFLMIIDACNSGQALEAEEKRRGPMNSKGLAQLAYEKGMYILTAAQSDQEAKGAGKLGHGYLTYSLVQEGLLTDKADGEPKDRQVLLREWLDYGTRRVPQMQSEANEIRKITQGDKSAKSGDNGGRGEVQQPRVFYRREPETSPFIVAKP